MDDTLNQSVKSMASNNLNRLFLSIIIASVILGAGAGYFLSRSSSKQGVIHSAAGVVGNTPPKTAQQDTSTFRDFAEGVIQKKPKSTQTDDYSEGTHLLIRDGAVPVALTSSVVDLSQYEGKKVKVFGETQKALKEGWLMDVGRVEVEN